MRSDEMKNEIVDVNGRPTIFPTLLEAAELPGKAKIDNVLDEAYTILGAAADTTGNALTTIARHVVSNPSIYRKLHAELVNAFPEKDAGLAFSDLEKLPYLVGNVEKYGYVIIADPQPVACHKRRPTV